MDRIGDDGGQHSLEIERGVNRLAHFTKRPQFFDRPRQLARARLYLVKQPRVLDRNHRLVSEGGYQFDLLLGEWIYLVAREVENTDRGSLAQQRYTKDSPITECFLIAGGAIFWISQHVRNLNSSALQSHSSGNAAAA